MKVSFHRSNLGKQRIDIPEIVEVDEETHKNILEKTVLKMNDLFSKNKVLLHELWNQHKNQ